ncbi:MAG: DUF4417 domain-containing protein [Candidatus Levybacteria bacterium]|nr:DUF4417 domain-containing protein [Candidatus Levybacteria bacterium]
MDIKQLGLWDNRSDRCPFVELLEEDDNHCFSFGQPKDGYEVIAEDTPFFANWLADIGNVGFNNIEAKQTPLVKMPPFIPVVKRGSQKILNENIPPFVAISLSNILSPKELSMPTSDIRSKFGIDPRSKVLLLCYAKDGLIEKLWPRRKEVFKRIASLGFDLVTSVNYSIWLNHPHAERLINPKRSLITFQELQELGVPVVPHIYWTGKKDLVRWSDWLSNNKRVSTIAINLQTERERGNRIWNQTVEDLSFFVSLLNRPLHFIITGPSKPERVRQLLSVLPNFTLTNGSSTRKAASGYLIKEDHGSLRYEHNNEIPKNKILGRNIKFYEELMVERLIQPNNVIKPKYKEDVTRELLLLSHKALASNPAVI